MRLDAAPGRDDARYDAGDKASADPATASSQGVVADLRRRVAELETLVAEQAERLDRAEEAVVVFGSVRVLRLERRAEAAGKPLKLLPREYELLLALTLGGGEIVEHGELERRVWKRRLDSGTDALAVHVSRLRSKLAGTGVAIETARGAGYRLVASGRDPASSSSKRRAIA